MSRASFAFRPIAVGLLISIIGISIPSLANAGFFDGVGKAVGGVFRGVGSVFGQGLAGLAQPTVDDAANRMQTVINSAISNADAAAGKRIEEVSSILSANMDKADGILTEQLLRLDEIITRKLGAIDVIGAKQINNFEQSVKELIRYSSLVFLLSACIFVVFIYLMKKYYSDRLVSISVEQVGVICVILIICSGVGFLGTVLFNNPSESRIHALRNELLKSYRFSLVLGDLNGATFYGSQLSALDSSNLSGRLMSETADLQRDLLLRPALTKSAKGLQELLTKVSRLQITAEQAHSSGSLVTESFIKSELDATASMLRWQTALSEKDEIDATCLAMRALLAHSDENAGTKVPTGGPNTASPYIWLSYTYAKWAAAKASNENQDCDGKNTITSYLTRLRPLIEKFDNSEPNAVVAGPVLYNRAAIRYYEEASSLYSTLVVTDVQFRVKSASGIAAGSFLAERDAAAAKLVGAWQRFVESVAGTTGLSGGNMVLAMNGLPLGLATRAALIAASPAGARPAYDVNTCRSLATQLAAPASQAAALTTVDGKFLSLFEPAVQQIVCTERAKIDQSLVSFETEVQQSYAPGVNTSLAKQALIKDSAVYRSYARALNACIIVADASIGGDRGCTNEELSPIKSFALWLSPAGSPPEYVQRIAFVR